MFSFFLLVLLCKVSEGLFVDFNEAETVCFLEESPKDTLIQARWSVDPHSLPDLGIRLTIADPQNYQFFVKDFPTGPEPSKFVFTSAKGGEYRLCFSTNTSTWFGSGQALAFTVDVFRGADAVDYSALAKSEHLSAVELGIRKLLDRLRLIRAEQEYQRKRERKFRNTSETTNQRALFLSLVQIGVLVVLGVWQTSHLRNFFIAKKLV